MRIVLVKANAFGPLKGEVLELAPRMNVIHGPNESGKSSWHSAIYAALCGKRRTRGRGTREAQLFSDKHYPWLGRSWKVAARVQLDNGDELDVIQDLSPSGNSQVIDVATRVPLTTRFLSEGGVDLSSLFGLTRHTSLATPGHGPFR